MAATVERARSMARAVIVEQHLPGASAVAAAVGPLGLTTTGADAAKEWLG
jgi:hypothetical protein